MPNFTYISQPFGSHDSPDFIIKDEIKYVMCTVHPRHKAVGSSFFPFSVLKIFAVDILI